MRRMVVAMWWVPGNGARELRSFYADLGSRTRASRRPSRCRPALRSAIVHNVRGGLRMHLELSTTRSCSSRSCSSRSTGPAARTSPHGRSRVQGRLKVRTARLRVSCQAARVGQRRGLRSCRFLKPRLPRRLRSWSRWSRALAQPDLLDWEQYWRDVGSDVSASVDRPAPPRAHVRRACHRIDEIVYHRYCTARRGLSTRPHLRAFDEGSRCPSSCWVTSRLL